MKITPDFKTFCQLAKKGNTIPVYAEIMADLETPVSSYLKTHQGAEGFLLESVEGGRSQARFSFIGIEPDALIIHERNQTRLMRQGKLIKKFIGQDPLSILKSVLSKYRYVESPDLPRFCGGAVGYLSYECNRFFEKTRAPKGRPEFPDVFYMITQKLLVFDHLMRKVKIVSNAHLGGATSPAALRCCTDRAALP